MLQGAFAKHVIFQACYFRHYVLHIACLIFSFRKKSLKHDIWKKFDRKLETKHVHFACIEVRIKSNTISMTVFMHAKAAEKIN